MMFLTERSKEIFMGRQNWLMLFGFLLIATGSSASLANAAGKTGKTEILKWPEGKKGAISLTYDDGTVNQFKVAMPIMDKYGLPGTFFIITGEVKGSKYKPHYSGRPFAQILKESAKPTTVKNFIERVTALRFSGYEGMAPLHEKIGGTFEGNKIKEAYQLVDDAYAKIRKGEIKKASAPEFGVPGAMSWDDFRGMAAKGHEFASHTVSHPYLSTFDSKNLHYELEKSRYEIREQLGPKYTFSVEYPYGTEDKRVLRLAMHLYPLVRNWMDDAGIQDLIRWDEMDPLTSKKEYVRWQRGPHTNTPIELMKKWVDTTNASDKIWLTLVFHGVDGIGWEPEPRSKFEDYFNYISKRKDLWVGTFQDVGKYIREKLSTKVSTKVSKKSIQVRLVSPLSHHSYDYPLSVKTYVPADWKRVKVEQKEGSTTVEARASSSGTYVVYQAVPNMGAITIQPEP
jgi:peptidoglycan/xylan/chitin deacetylase (PgdA/CDA1 family)